LSRFLIVGDNDVTGESELVYTAMKKVTNVSRYIHAGDLPYADYGKKWIKVHKKFWTEQEKDALWRVTRGNHDCHSSQDYQTQWDLEQYFKRYYDKEISPSEDEIDNNMKNTWLEYEFVDNVLIINMDSEDLDVEKTDSDQYDWVSKKVAPEVKRLKTEGKIDWVFVLFHRPFFTLKTKHKPYTSVRFLYRNIFKDIEVDVCIHGHNHNTQLWYPMRPHPTDVNAVGKQLFSYSSDGKTLDFTKEHGWLTIISGHGGHEWNKIIEDEDEDGKKNVMHYRDSGLFGFTQIDINGKNMNVKSFDSDLKVPLFEYSVTKGV
jgi:calcineurin-like phosphoesterase family protein